MFGDYARIPNPATPLLIYLPVVVAVAIWQRSWLSLPFGATAAVLGVLRVWTWDTRDGL